jgi:phage baseplate assembly protein W
MASTITKKDVFKDLSLKFFAHPETGAVPVLKNENAIKQQVKNLIFTNRYETLFRPNVYGGIYDALFDGFDPVTVQTVKSSIEDVINNYAKRAELLEITLTDRSDQNAIEVTVIIKPLNFPNPVTIQFFLQRTR